MKPIVATEKRRCISSIGLIRIHWMPEATLSTEPGQEITTAGAVDDQLAARKEGPAED